MALSIYNACEHKVDRVVGKEHIATQQILTLESMHEV